MGVGLWYRIQNDSNLHRRYTYCGCFFDLLHVVMEHLIKVLYIAKEYVDKFINYSLPNVPHEGQISIASYLLSTETLSYVASHLGMKELLLDADYPPSKESMAQSLLAVIGALDQSSGLKDHTFCKRFICTLLNQKIFLKCGILKNQNNYWLKYARKRTCPESRLLAIVERIRF
ncbi:39S ribosomal protein L44, mitochondrial [Eumeta japonica]|uniref:39S ribosomal protein L44, mitochondrial n=1 Tax=Eumeta variegata TaxID=151549 RepID=A0A4C1SV58_EUMVA|nr:39S ribosomal protein L44, mitochondrial [Eumeta japonica]